MAQLWQGAARRVCDIFRDPASTLLAVGALAGIGLVFAIPTFQGINEPAHFLRAYQLSTGEVRPTPNPTGEPGSGGCFPGHVLAELGALGLERSGLTPAEAASQAGDATTRTTRCPGSADERYSDFSTFAWYSPIPYIPQAIGISAGRAMGLNLEWLDRLGRLAGLSVFLAISYFAVRRTVGPRWGFTVITLLPISLALAAVVSPDAITAAMALAVVSSALLAIAKGNERSIVSLTVEACVLAVLLALCKPVYAVAALAYLAPLMTRQWDRIKHFAPLALAVVTAGVASTLWQASARNLFICDVRFFGVHADPDAQTSLLLHRPWRLLELSAEAVGDSAIRYAGLAFQVTASYTGTWPTGLWLLVAAYALVLGLQRDEGHTWDPSLGQRLLFLATGVIGVIAVYAGFIVYCSAVDRLYQPFIGPRHFVPLAPLFAVALLPPSSIRNRIRWPRVPVSLGLLPGYATFVYAVAVQTR